MNLAGFTVIIGALLVGPGDEAPPPVRIAVYAVQVTDEQRKDKYYDPVLQPVRRALDDLKFDTFREVRTATLTVSLNEEASLKLDSKFTLFVKPLSREQSGQVRLDVRVEMPPKKRDQKPIKVFETRIAMAPGKPFRACGLKLEEGELVVVLSIPETAARSGRLPSLRRAFR